MSLIYHYCSPDTFLKIIEGKTIWLSAINNMNDYLEGDFVCHSLKRVLDKKVNKNPNDNFQDLKDLWDTYIHNLGMPYIACFSKNGDSLSQWRAYAQDGFGIAIGLDEDALNIQKESLPLFHPQLKHSTSLCNIEYKSAAEIDEIITNIIDKNLSEFKNEPEEFIALTQKLVHLTLTIKNSAFIEENEKRIIYRPMIMGNLKTNETSIALPHEGLSIKYRISQNKLTSYFEYEFPKKSIKEIILGPKNIFSDYDISTFLGLNNLGLINVKRSIASYR